MAAHPIYWVEGVRSTLHAGIGSYRRHFRIVPRSDILPLPEALQEVPNTPQECANYFISKRRICADLYHHALGQAKLAWIKEKIVYVDSTTRGLMPLLVEFLDGSHPDPVIKRSVIFPSIEVLYNSEESTWIVPFLYFDHVNRSVSCKQFFSSLKNRLFMAFDIDFDKSNGW